MNHIEPPNPADLQVRVDYDCLNRQCPVIDETQLNECLECQSGIQTLATFNDEEVAKSIAQTEYCLEICKTVLQAQISLIDKFNQID